MRSKSLALLFGVTLLTPACATTRTTSTTWTEPPDGTDWERNGHVEWVRETIEEQHGNPAAGATAGAVIGGLLGAMLTRGHGGGAFFGAASGAMIGAAESQGHSEHRTYNVAVRFDDGGARVFTYHGYPPFRPGEAVSLTPQGLVADTFTSYPPHASAGPPPPPVPNAKPDASEAQPSTPPPKDPPPPPPPTPTPPAAQAAQPQGERADADGQWAFTEQYGWVWMPSGVEYTFTPDYDNGDPYMYVYYPEAGWTWVAAPWLWGWGPMPHFRVGANLGFGWYGHGWGEAWHGDRPAHYRYRGGVSRGRSPGRRHR